jgi:hypothetical protein
LRQAIRRTGKKKIDVKAAASILERLNDAAKDDSLVSQQRFVIMNFDVLSRFVRHSGENVRTVYEYLKAGGLNVGTYHGFRSACYRAGLRRRVKNRAPVPEESPDGVRRIRESQKAEGISKTAKERGAGAGRRNPSLPPVYLPGGVEVTIDPESGAKYFEIKSGKTGKGSEAT